MKLIYIIIRVVFVSTKLYYVQGGETLHILTVQLICECRH